MAIYRLAADVVKRSSGRAVTAAAAYRAGDCITDQRLGLVFDYRPRSGVAHADIMAPADAPAWMHDRAALWNAVEALERRKDAQLARDIVLALPHELTPAQRRVLVRDFVAAVFVDAGMVADVAIHVPDRHGDERNHHAHLLLTMRAIAGDGFGPKVRAWNETGLLEQWRTQWADHVNRALELAGDKARVDHRSLAARGIDRLPQPKLGPAAQAMEARGIFTDRGDELRAVLAANASIIVAHVEPIESASPASITAPGHDQASTPPADPDPPRHDDADRRIAWPVIHDHPKLEAFGVRPDLGIAAGAAARPNENPGMAPVSKNRTTGATRRLFRAAVKAVTRRAEHPPPKPRRRSGDTGKAFMLAAKGMTRRVFQLPPEAYAAASGFLSDTLDWLNLWHHGVDDGSEPQDDFDVSQNHLSLHL